MRQKRLLAALVVAVAARAWGQITVTAPAALDAVAPADDYATQVLQDPWDMTERTDFGWFLFSVDQPAANLANPTFSGGLFSATTTTDDPTLFPLETGYLGTAPIGKVGTNYPIDASKYTVLALRMSLGSASGMHVFWSRNTIYEDQSGAGTQVVSPGWRFYFVNIPGLTQFLGAIPWSGLVRSLRIDPTAVASDPILIDWVRLVRDDAGLKRTIAWTGSTSVDIYLDNDNSAANGNLGAVAKNVTGSSYSGFFVGALPAGDYYVAITQAGGGTYSYSPGFYRVDDVPTLRFTAPSEEGSSDDFATVQLNDAWDMAATSDVDYAYQVTSLGVASIPAEDLQGNNLGVVSLLQGTSQQAPVGQVGDPSLYLLGPNSRGLNYRIDPDRYRILTAEIGTTGARDLVNGSVARIIWRVAGETLENVSGDVVVDHKSGSNVLQRISADMKTLPLETDPGGSPSLTGWNPGFSLNPGLDEFRLDPHEFASPRDFFVRRVKLAAREKTNAGYQIQWQYSNPVGTATTLSLFYDETGSGYAGSPIVSGLDPTVGAYSWDTSGLTHGHAYYVYGRLLRGPTLVNQAYARWPVVKDANYLGDLPRIVLSRKRLNFGATNNGTIKTTAQEVGLDMVGAGSVAWSVTADQSYILPSPTSGSGAGAFTVAMEDRSNYPAPAQLGGAVAVTGTGASNSPQYVPIYFNIYTPAQTTAPFGVIDSPLDGATGIQGSVDVTGWALDDIQVTKVDIWRDPIGGEPTDPNGLVYIGDAVFSAGARPDIEAAYPSYPMHYRAGWSYTLITGTLPNSGNGTYKLWVYAHDAEGKQTLLGTRTITCNGCAVVVSNVTVTTTVTYTSCGTLTLGPAFRVESPAHATLRAAVRVIMANGFSIGSGAVVAAGLDPALAP